MQKYVKKVSAQAFDTAFWGQLQRKCYVQERLQEVLGTIGNRKCSDVRTWQAIQNNAAILCLMYSMPTHEVNIAAMAKRQ